MAIIKRVVNSDGQHYGYRFHCPGCDEEHVIPTKQGVWDGRYFSTGGPGNGWDFDGNESAPTSSPSIHVHPSKRWNNGVAVDTPRCHSFVNAGRIAFLSDSTHALAGQTVPLPEIA